MKGVEHMASFQKRGKTWQYTISRMVNGKSKPIRKGGFKTKKEAQIAAAEVEAKLAKGIVPHLKPEPFDEYFKDWIKLYKSHVNKNTKYRYLTTLKTIQEYFGSTPIQNITKRDYQKFLNEYAKNHSKNTVKKLNSHVRACVQEAIDEGIIQVDFTRNVSLSGKEGKNKEEKYLNYEESKKLLNYLYKNLDKGMTNYLLLLGLTTGMRYGELVGLTRKDFDFKNNTINVDKTWGYTNKMHEGFGPTKNPQSVRKIKVDSKTMQVFKNLFDTVPDNIYRLVFYSSQSKYKVISNANANKVLENILKELKIETIITAHGLRHTHASVLLYQGVSIYYVSERLGHADIETTLRVYSHVVKELRVRDELESAKVYEKMYV